jgi:hypothetical protein
MDLVEHINVVSGRQFGRLEPSTGDASMAACGPVMATPAVAVVIAAGAFGLGIGVAVGRAQANGRQPRLPSEE